MPVIQKVSFLDIEGLLDTESRRSDINYYWWLTVELREGDFSRVPCLSANDTEILDHYNLGWNLIVCSHLVDIIAIPVYPIM